jgi:hypothetical protein
MKTGYRVFGHVVLDTADDEPLEPGDDLVEDADITPTTNERPTATRAAVEAPDEADLHARITRDHLGDQSGRVDTLRTAEVNLVRDRRDTLTSPISALIAESMTEVSEPRPGRDPAAPQAEGRDLTRRVGDSDRQREARDSSAGYAVEVSNDQNAQRRVRAARLIDQARALMDSGALVGAVVAAEHALEEAEKAAPPGIAEVIEPARALFAKVFSTYVGRLDEVPVMAKRVETIPPTLLDDRRRAVIALVDGQRTLAEVLDAARLHASDGLRIAAALMREGIIRTV